MSEAGGAAASPGLGSMCGRLVRCETEGLIAGLGHPPALPPGRPLPVPAQAVPAETMSPHPSHRGLLGGRLLRQIEARGLGRGPHLLSQGALLGREVTVGWRHVGLRRNRHKQVKQPARSRWWADTKPRRRNRGEPDPGERWVPQRHRWSPAWWHLPGGGGLWSPPRSCWSLRAAFGRADGAR